MQPGELYEEETLSVPSSSPEEWFSLQPLTTAPEDNFSLSLDDSFSLLGSSVSKCVSLPVCVVWSISLRKQGKKIDFLEYEVLRGLVFFTLADKYGSYYF